MSNSMLKPFKSLFIEIVFLKFIIVGVINTIVGTAIMLVLYNVFHFGYWFSSASNYVIDSTKGDEFQMNTRSGTASFMDILNNKVVHQTRERIYKNPDPDDGGLLLDRDAMTNHV